MVTEKVVGNDQMTWKKIRRYGDADAGSTPIEWLLADMLTRNPKSVIVQWRI